MAKRRPPKDKTPALHSSMDDVEYDDDDGPNPVPDDDGNVVLRRTAKQEGAAEKRGKEQTRKKPRRLG